MMDTGNGAVNTTHDTHILVEEELMEIQGSRYNFR